MARLSRGIVQATRRRISEQGLRQVVLQQEREVARDSQACLDVMSGQSQRKLQYPPAVRKGRSERTHLQPHIINVKQGLDETACRANAG